MTIAFVLPLIVAAYMFSAWLFMVCFNFAAPVFWAGAPTLGYLHAVATVTLLGYIRGIHVTKTKG